MSLFIPPLFERVPLYTQDGHQCGWGLRRWQGVIEPQAAFTSEDDRISMACSLIIETEDAQRYD